MNQNSNMPVKDGQKRSNIKYGLHVAVVCKEDQSTEDSYQFPYPSPWYQGTTQYR